MRFKFLFFGLFFILYTFQNVKASYNCPGGIDFSYYSNGVVADNFTTSNPPICLPCSKGSFEWGNECRICGSNFHIGLGIISLLIMFLILPVLIVLYHRKHIMVEIFLAVHFMQILGVVTKHFSLGEFSSIWFNRISDISSIFLWDLQSGFGMNCYTTNGTEKNGNIFTYFFIIMFPLLLGVLGMASSTIAGVWRGSDSGPSQKDRTIRVSFMGMWLALLAFGSRGFAVFNCVKRVDPLSLDEIGSFMTTIQGVQCYQWSGDWLTYTIMSIFPIIYSISVPVFAIAAFLKLYAQYLMGDYKTASRWGFLFRHLKPSRAYYGGFISAVNVIYILLIIFEKSFGIIAIISSLVFALFIIFLRPYEHKEVNILAFSFNILITTYLLTDYYISNFAENLQIIVEFSLVVLSFGLFFIGPILSYLIRMKRIQSEEEERILGSRPVSLGDEKGLLKPGKKVSVTVSSRDILSNDISTNLEGAEEELVDIESIPIEEQDDFDKSKDIIKPAAPMKLEEYGESEDIEDSNNIDSKFESTEEEEKENNKDFDSKVETSNEEQNNNTNTIDDTHLEE